MAATKPVIVIVGGGTGGLNLATRLGKTLGRKGRAEIILVDENLSHVWKPSLHEYASGTIGADREISFLEHASRNNYIFRLGRFSAVDIEKKEITLDPVTGHDDVEIAPRRVLAYDWLVMAIGSRSNDFGVPGVQENCLFLDTPAQARRLQSTLLNICLKLETGALESVADKNGTEQEAGLNVCIVGAGATGVELAAELREATDMLARNGLECLRERDNFRITLVEASDRIVSGLPEKISVRATAHLREIGIDVRTSCNVSAVGKDHVMLNGDEKLPSNLVIWAAGIRAPAVLETLQGLEYGPLGRLLVKPTLQTTNSDSVFAMGDCAACEWTGRGTTLPPRAQVASQQAPYLAKQLARMLDGQPLEPFRYVDRGSLLAISKHTAFGSLMGKSIGTFTFQGWLARRAYRYLHYDHESAVRGHFRAMLRLILSTAMKRVRPQLKLH